MKQRIYRNILFLSSLTVVLVTILFTFFFTDTLRNQLEENLKNESEYLIPIFEKDSDFSEYLKAEGASYEYRITLIDADGVVTFDSVVEDVSAMGNHLERPEIQEAIQNGTGKSFRLSDTLLMQICYYAVRLDQGGFLRISGEEVSLFECLRRILPLLVAITAGIMLLAILIAKSLTRHIMDGINSIDIHDPLSGETFPELVFLQNRLEHQNERISKQMLELKEQEEQFQTITGHMNEGLLMIDRSEHIAYMNQSCKDIFGMSGVDFSGQHIARFYRGKSFQEVIKNNLQGKSCEASETFGEKKLQFIGDPIVEDSQFSGAVLLIIDITERERSERLRKEFSANVSHELKTPLTSIMGYAELIENQMVMPDDIPGFSAKIRKEAQRLLALVNDIIKISQLDDSDIHQEKSVLNLLAMAQDMKQRLEELAMRQKVEIIVAGEEANIYCIPQLMNDLIYNLMENAIKYNIENGKVFVTTGVRNKVPYIKVKDTGIGIPAEYQKRVFERFFRVDKSHSKQTGGTGLGLSIVKHVVEYTGGHIEIHSEPGHGTEITAFLGIDI